MLLFTLLLCGLPTASAQDTDEVLVEVGECIDIEAPVERLACFAAQVEQALTESEAAASDDGDAIDAVSADDATVEVVPAQPADPEPASPAAANQDSNEDQEHEAEMNVATAEAVAEEENLNWFERRRARRAARAAEREAEERAEAAEVAANEIVATITELRERQPNAWLITLDNGQMWDQVRPQWYPLRPGQQVRLYPTNWGSSYRLTEFTQGGYIQVQRVR